MQTRAAATALAIVFGLWAPALAVDAAGEAKTSQTDGKKQPKTVKIDNIEYLLPPNYVFVVGPAKGYEFLQKGQNWLQCLDEGNSRGVDWDYCKAEADCMKEFGDMLAKAKKDAEALRNSPETRSEQEGMNAINGENNSGVGYSAFVNKGDGSSTRKDFNGGGTNPETPLIGNNSQDPGQKKGGGVSVFRSQPNAGGESKVTKTYGQSGPGQFPGPSGAGVFGSPPGSNTKINPYANVGGMMVSGRETPGSTVSDTTLNSICRISMADLAKRASEAAASYANLYNNKTVNNLSKTVSPLIQGGGSKSGSSTFFDNAPRGQSDDTLRRERNSNSLRQGGSDPRATYHD